MGSLVKSRLPASLLEARPGLAFNEDEAVAPGSIGRPPAKYTRAVHDSIVENIKKFNRPLVAAQIAGISAAIYHHWMRLGKAGDPHLWEFADDVEQAMAVAEGLAIEKVVAAAEADPENFKWWLERSRPEAYSKDVAARVNGELENFVKRLELQLDPATFERVLACFAGQPAPAVALLTPHDPQEE